MHRLLEPVQPHIRYERRSVAAGIELSERKYVTTENGLQAVADSVLRVLQQDVARSAQSGRTVIQELPGEWDLQKAEPLVLGTLKERETEIRNPDYCSFSGQKEPMWSRILGDYYLRYRRRETMIVVTASLEEGDQAHVSAPRLSLFEFARTSSGWSLVESSLAVTSWGAWGDVNDGDVKVFVIGDNNFALFLDGGYTAQGITVTTTTVQARIGDRYREILEVQTSAYDGSGMRPEPECWQAVITTKPGTSAFYDLLVQRKGQRGTRDFEETELFRFNGHKYVSGDVYR